MTDYTFERAVTAAKRAWTARNNGEWGFSEIAANLQGEYGSAVVKRLAKEIQQSDDVVYRRIHAWTLWTDLSHKDNAGAETLRDDLYISHWCAVGDAYTRKGESAVSLSEAGRILTKAHNEGWTVEQTRKALPRDENKHSFVKDAQRLAKELRYRVIMAPRLDAVEPWATDVVEAALNFADIVETAQELEELIGGE